VSKLFIGYCVRTHGTTDGVGDGLNYTWNKGQETVKERYITAPVVAPVAAVAGIAGGAVTGVGLLTGTSISDFRLYHRHVFLQVE
jgi:hypothetical protein